MAVNPKRAWAGLYEMSPDHHCILGPVAEVPGFFCANGFSGHGVMHSPATGRILADLILHGKTEVVSNVEAAQPRPLRQRRAAARNRSSLGKRGTLSGFVILSEDAPKQRASESKDLLVVRTDQHCGIFFASLAEAAICAIRVHLW